MYEAHGGSGEPEVQPNVYHPQTAPAPSYEEYADPAAAHGWQNAYDETREQPALTLSGPSEPSEPSEPSGPAEPHVPAAGGEGGGRRDRRRKRRAGARRRTAVLAGGLGAAGAVAVIAVLAWPDGAPSGARPASDGPARVPGSATTRVGSSAPATSAPGAESGLPATSSSTAAVPAADAPAATATGGPTAPDASAAPGSPAATASVTPAPTLTAATPTESGGGTPVGGRGHGHGATKRPR